jgi:hypothetical protein
VLPWPRPGPAWCGRKLGSTLINRCRPAGIYTFTLTTDGVSTTVPARYSYVYKKQTDGSYKILTHHSSALPEKGTARRMAIEAGGWLPALIYAQPACLLQFSMASPFGRRSLTPSCTARCPPLTAPGLDYAFYEKEVKGGNFRKLLQSATTGADAVAKSLFSKWAASLKLAPADVVANYAKDGVLVGCRAAPPGPVPHTALG